MKKNSGSISRTHDDDFRFIKRSFSAIGRRAGRYSWFIPAEDRTVEENEAVKRSDDAIAQLHASDIIVISVPIYNFGIPSSLKAYIDHIARGVMTFRYSKTVLKV